MSLELQFKHPSLPCWLPVSHPLLPACLRVPPSGAAGVQEAERFQNYLDLFQFAGKRAKIETQHVGDHGLQTTRADLSQKAGDCSSDKETKTKLLWLSARRRCACCLLPPQETLQTPYIDLLRLGPNQQVVFGRKPGLETPSLSPWSLSFPSPDSASEVASFSAFRFPADSLARSVHLEKLGDASRPRTKLRRSVASQGSRGSSSQAEGVSSQVSEEAESVLSLASSGRPSDLPRLCSSRASSQSNGERAPASESPLDEDKKPTTDLNSRARRFPLLRRPRARRHSEEAPFVCGVSAHGLPPGHFAAAREPVSASLPGDKPQEPPDSPSPVHTVYLPSLDPLLSRRHFCVTRLRSPASCPSKLDGRDTTEQGEIDQEERVVPRFVLTSKAAKRGDVSRENGRDEGAQRNADFKKAFEQGLQGIVLVNTSSPLSASLDLRPRLDLLAPTVRAAVQAAIDASAASDPQKHRRFSASSSDPFPRVHAVACPQDPPDRLAPGSERGEKQPRPPRCTYTHFVYEPHVLQDGDEIYIPVDDAFLKKDCLGSKENSQRLSNSSTGTDHWSDRARVSSQDPATSLQSSESPSTSVCRSCGQTTPLFCFRYVFHAPEQPPPRASRPMSAETLSLLSSPSSASLSPPIPDSASASAHLPTLSGSVQSSSVALFESPPFVSPVPASGTGPRRSSPCSSVSGPQPDPDASLQTCFSPSLSSPSVSPLSGPSSVSHADKKYVRFSVRSLDSTAPRIHEAPAGARFGIEWRVSLSRQEAPAFVSSVNSSFLGAVASGEKTSRVAVACSRASPAQDAPCSARMWSGAAADSPESLPRAREARRQEVETKQRMCGDRSQENRVAVWTETSQIELLRPFRFSPLAAAAPPATRGCRWGPQRREENREGDGGEGEREATLDLEEEGRTAAPRFPRGSERYEATQDEGSSHAWRSLPQYPERRDRGASAAGRTDRPAEGDSRADNGDSERQETHARRSRRRSWKEVFEAVRGETESSNGSQETVLENNQEERPSEDGSGQGLRKVDRDHGSPRGGGEPLQRKRSGGSDPFQDVFWQKERRARRRSSDGRARASEEADGLPGSFPHSSGREKDLGLRPGVVCKTAKDSGVHRERTSVSLELDTRWGEQATRLSPRTGRPTAAPAGDRGETHDADLEELKALSFDLGDEERGASVALEGAVDPKEPSPLASGSELSASRRDREETEGHRQRDGTRRNSLSQRREARRDSVGTLFSLQDEGRQAGAPLWCPRREAAPSSPIPLASPQVSDTAGSSGVFASPGRGLSPLRLPLDADGDRVTTAPELENAHSPRSPQESERRKDEGWQGERHLDRLEPRESSRAERRERDRVVQDEGQEARDDAGRSRGPRTLVTTQTDEIADILNMDFNDSERETQWGLLLQGPSARTRASASLRSPRSSLSESSEAPSASLRPASDTGAAAREALEFSPSLSSRPPGASLAGALFTSPSVASDRLQSDDTQGLFCSAGDICAICTEDLLQKDEIGTLACMHQFCFTCISRWGGIRNYCPLCKQEFREISRHHFAVSPRGPVSPRKSSSSLRRVRLVFDEAVAVRRAGGRLARDSESDATVAQLLAEDQASRGASSQALPAPGGCQVCGRDTDWDQLLLCDGCEDGYHLYCLTPRFYAVPEGPWYCRQCCEVSTTAETNTLQTIARERTRLLSSASLSYFLDDEGEETRAEDGDARARRRSLRSRASVSPSVAAGLFSSSPNAVSLGPRAQQGGTDGGPQRSDAPEERPEVERPSRGLPVLRGRRRARGFAGRAGSSPRGLSRSPSPAGPQRETGVSSRLLHDGALLERFRTPTETLASYERRRAQTAFEDQGARLPTVSERSGLQATGSVGAQRRGPTSGDRADARGARGELPGGSDAERETCRGNEAEGSERREGRRRFLISVSSSEDESGGWRRCPRPLAQPGPGVAAPTAVGGAVSAAAARQWMEGCARTRGARRSRTSQDSEESDLDGFVVKDDEVVYSSGSDSEAESSCGDSSSCSDSDEEPRRRRNERRRRGARNQRESPSVSPRARTRGPSDSAGRVREAKGARRPEKRTFALQERMSRTRKQVGARVSAVGATRRSSSAEREVRRPSQYFVANRRRLRCVGTSEEGSASEEAPRWHSKRGRRE
ncbi:PHD-finger domain-containing protein [Toxoplasma gondii GT1]|uniref:PHD-finger domain-containing protein n=3 Tax=Toxoplasma gondii TaxID=5811 RepID=S7UVD7_TOXGG|nr:PHD-finger domain-containing protein [Toxoplasma gondii GT1]KAF4642763.1 PHD-finger domain-containing protein [Toxoplasma gondii]KFG39511.1 PHD-finger domain-containing protein [Toxoplasma gondii FOU]